MVTPWESEWQLNSDDAIMGDSGISLFHLVKGSANGLTYYKVDFESGEMKNLWRGCVFVQRGSKPMVWQGAPLPRWVKDQHGNFPARRYRERIDENLEYTNASTNRLEGEVSHEGAQSWVMFFLARRAVERPSGPPADLLIVQYDDKFEWTKHEFPGPIEDGTGHGDSLK
jgi:hypothetical protein